MKIVNIAQANNNLMYRNFNIETPRLLRSPGMTGWWKCHFERSEKSNLKSLIDVVKPGGTVLIMDRDRPAARRESALTEKSPDAEGCYILAAADSLQLAAALFASENKPSTLDSTCLDSRLASAAQKEGFSVINI